MLTAAKLVGALLFAAVGYFAALEVIGGLTDSLFAEGRNYDWFARSIAILGLWQGWAIMGGLVGRGWGAAAGNGIRTSVQIVVIGLIFYALREMFIRSANLRYSDFGVAIIEALELFLEYGGEFLTVPSAIVVLLVGGVIAGLLTELASRLWR